MYLGEELMGHINCGGTAIEAREAPKAMHTPKPEVKQKKRV